MKRRAQGPRHAKHVTWAIGSAPLLCTIQVILRLIVINKLVFFNYCNQDEFLFESSFNKLLSWWILTSVFTVLMAFVQIRRRHFSDISVTTNTPPCGIVVVLFPITREGSGEGGSILFEHVQAACEINPVFYISFLSMSVFVFFFLLPLCSKWRLLNWIELIWIQRENKILPFFPPLK